MTPAQQRLRDSLRTAFYDRIATPDRVLNGICDLIDERIQAAKEPGCEHYWVKGRGQYMCGCAKCQRLNEEVCEKCGIKRAELSDPTITDSMIESGMSVWPRSEDEKLETALRRAYRAMCNARSKE